MRLFPAFLAGLLAVDAGAPVASAQALRRATETSIAVAGEPLVSEPLAAEPLAAARDELAAELETTRHARRVASVPPGWAAALRAVERRVGASWSGPPPVLLQVPDDGSGFLCEPGAAIRERCRGRTEGVREGDRRAFVLLFASSAMLDRRVWEHELAHAMLEQLGRTHESRSHDPRYFR